ncbi:hypothetical protein KIN20_009956 [Parelaphostrongylus tenuis]|uniref:Uncharacterized protein n=1 Tax=Parelaphostrongylus tenuis TaxID=148309 RepID=A0AAD5MPW3_PARTN|nr:hypothetical protein KIN20_009956 [Parelaphostrongylus tenuis]
MQTVFNVLESQGRGALLPDAVISAILSQLEITITYEPLSCQKVLDGPADVTQLKMADPPSCIIVSNTVTGICTVTVDDKMCMEKEGRIMPIPADHIVNPRNFFRRNFCIDQRISLMANWSRTMWQNVVDQCGSNAGIGSIWIATSSRARAIVGGKLKKM